MKRSFLYGSLKAIIKIARHRIALARAGRGLGVSWARILRHDNSKFHPVEFSQYVKKHELGIYDEDKWAEAWRHHWQHNDHHIEYWEDKGYSLNWMEADLHHEPTVYVDGERVLKKRFCPTIETVKTQRGVFMPKAAIREMIADWIAASLAYAGVYPKAGSWVWANKNLINNLHRLEFYPSVERCPRTYAVAILEIKNLITVEQREQVIAHEKGTYSLVDLRSGIKPIV